MVEVLHLHTSKETVDGIMRAKEIQSRAKYVRSSQGKVGSSEGSTTEYNPG